MNEDFHYYATYCAALLAGYEPKESRSIAYSSAFVDTCTRTLLASIKGPSNACTTQTQMELMDAATDVTGLQDITRIWSSFHFLPKDLHADPGFGGRTYLEKYRLIAGPNGDLMVSMVKRARGGSLQQTGIAMHVLADTWAHRNFAGTPSLVINNTDDYFYEILPEGDRPIRFRHSVSSPDDLITGKYTGSLFQSDEHSIMNLGHGRAGHLPDYSFVRYRYLPAWDRYRECIKDNPAEYWCAFRQMIEAMKYLNGTIDEFGAEQYAEEEVKPYEERIKRIISIRRLSAAEDWKSLGIEIGGEDVAPFNVKEFQQEYMEAGKEEKDETFLGQFILGALDHKSHVTNEICRSGNRLAGKSIEYNGFGLKGIKDYRSLVDYRKDEE